MHGSQHKYFPTIWFPHTSPSYNCHMVPHHMVPITNTFPLYDSHILHQYVIPAYFPIIWFPHTVHPHHIITTYFPIIYCNCHMFSHYMVSHPKYFSIIWLLTYHILPHHCHLDLYNIIHITQVLPPWLIPVQYTSIATLTYTIYKDCHLDLHNIHIPNLRWHLNRRQLYYFPYQWNGQSINEKIMVVAASGCRWRR